MNKYQKLKNRYPLRRDIFLVLVLVLLILTAIIFPKSKEEKISSNKTEIIYIDAKSFSDSEVSINEPYPITIYPNSEIVIGGQTPPPEIFPDTIDFEWPVLDTFSLDSLYKYEPKSEGPPPPSEVGVVIGGHPVYDEIPKPLTPIEQNLVYPEILTSGDIEGPVVVQAFIDDKGIVQKCFVIKGFPGTGIDDAAIEAIKRTKFTPALQRNKPVGVWIAIPVTFELNK